MANWYKIPWNGTNYYYYASSPGSALNAMTRDYGLSYTPNIPVEPIDASQVPSNILAMVGQAPASSTATKPAPKPATKPKPAPKPAKPEPTIEEQIDTKMNDYIKEVTDKWEKFYDDWAKSKPEAPDPFSFDDALKEAQRQVSEEGSVDEYYQKQLDDFIKEGEIQRNEYLGRSGRTLEDITNREQYMIEKANKELRDALVRNDEGYAGRGLFFSGMRGREQQDMQKTAQSALDQFMYGQERSKEELLRSAIEKYGTDAYSMLAPNAQLQQQQSNYNPNDPYANMLNPSSNSILSNLANKYGSDYQGSYQRALEEYKYNNQQQRNAAYDTLVNSRANELWNKYLIGTLQPYQRSLQEYYASKPELNSYLSSGLGSLL